MEGWYQDRIYGQCRKISQISVQWLEKDEYQKYLDTYFSGNVQAAWDAVFLMCELFGATARYIARELEFVYNAEEEKAAYSFLKHVRSLPKEDAK